MPDDLHTAKLIAGQVKLIASQLAEIERLRTENGKLREMNEMLSGCIDANKLAKGERQ